MTHEAFREMLPLYVIGALDGDELYNFERYIAENRERCHLEIAEYQAVADQIALSAPTAQPSAAVYERIAAAIVEPRQPVSASSATPAAKVVAREPVAPRRDEPKGLNIGALLFRLVPWAAVAVLAVMVLNGNKQLQQRESLLQSMKDSYNELLGKKSLTEADLSKQQGSVADLSARLTAQAKDFQAKIDALNTQNQEQQRNLEIFRAANKQLSDEKDSLLRAADQMREQLERTTLQTAALQKKYDDQAQSIDMLMDPAIRVAPLADPKAESKAAAKVYWHGGRKAGLMVVSNLAPVVQSQGKCLEVWAICGTEPPVAAGTGWTDDSGHGVLQVKLAKDIACIDKFAVTIEKAGGVTTPEGSIILIGQ